MTTQKNRKLLGINGLGRIAKLTLWYHLQAGYFDGFVINIGRQVGKGLEDIIQTLETDSTYGPLGRFLYGCGEQNLKTAIIDESAGLFEINGLPVKVLCSDGNRNPRNIGWINEGVRLVVDCTGRFLDPTLPADDGRGSIRGHLESGAETVIASAPFKIKDPVKYPEDSEMLVYGINHHNYDPRKHRVISAASCTTTGLAHMVKPLLEAQETSHIVTASMSTVHAATNTQSILDSSPKAGASSLRKNRSIFDNIILTSTGAASALERVLPEIQRIGFMADSVRIPTNTVSLIMLNVTFHTHLDDSGEPIVNREYLNNIYKTVAEGPQKGLVVYSERQNVSSDIAGREASVVIEGHETHARTGFIDLPEGIIDNHGTRITAAIRIPVTHAKIFGWYDNEYGSYVTTLGKLSIHIHKNMK